MVSLLVVVVVLTIVNGSLSIPPMDNDSEDHLQSTYTSLCCEDVNSQGSFISEKDNIIKITFCQSTKPQYCPDDQNNTQGIGVLADCEEWLNEGFSESGVYNITPDEGEIYEVYCDMVTSDGGWTVIQRRKDGLTDFYRNWTEYKEGFGDLNGEFWLGLEKIHRLAKTGMKIRVDLQDNNNTAGYAEYSMAMLKNESNQYTITIQGYSGNIGDSFLLLSIPTKFSTKDRDNDNCEAHCAFQNQGAWWYNCCQAANLNGPYGSNFRWHPFSQDLSFDEMKVKRINL